MALMVAAAQAVIPMMGAARNNARWMAFAGAGVLCPGGLGGDFIRRPYLCLRDLGLFRQAGGGKFQFHQAHALQDHRCLGEPRRLHAVLGYDPGALRRRHGGLRGQPAAGLEGAGHFRSGDGRGGLLSVHSSDFQPLHPPYAAGRRRPGHEPAFAGHAASPFIRRFSISVTSAFPSPFPFPSRR